MAPLKQLKDFGNRPVQTVVTRTTRSSTNHIGKNNNVRSKRKADFSPSKENVKRTAMGDITNAKKIINDENKKTRAAMKPLKKTTVQAIVLPQVRTVLKPKQNENMEPPPAPIVNGMVTRAAVKQCNQQTNGTILKPADTKDVVTRIKTRLSNEFEKTEESLYSSALDISNSANFNKTSAKSSPGSEHSFKDANNLSTVSMVAQQLEVKLNLGNHQVPEGVLDFDKENWNDTFQVSHYAMDIFNYLRSREPKFEISDYMERQVCLTTWMRSLLVDWMVEVQESFELNHETLYLGVKLVDLYLSKVTVSKETLQLVGAAAMFVASKYDERIPPAIEDFMYICDGAYTRREITRMEINLLKICDFNLGMPISYRFLRRYARCAKITMPVLTLARFVLEYSLMDYATVTVRDSKLAAAALYLALRMKNISGWTKAMEFYSGYTLPEILGTVVLLNTGLHRKPKSPLMTVRNKYSHKIFFEVAKTPLLTNDELTTDVTRK